MKVAARLIDLIVAFCIRQYWQMFSGRQLSAQGDALSRTSSAEQNDAAAKCLPLKRDLDNDDLNLPPPR
ncbi:hypothetical protein A1D31_37975 [Bradyrhizobium liaoningense]|nr:hypothetical protein A1D31_37975 [Bradyrhizobium liaoningense]